MRSRVETLIALVGIAVIPAVSDAAASRAAASLSVAVKPRSGSPTTHFVVSFRAAETTGRVGSAHRSYRITVSDRTSGGCQASDAAQGPP
jgi:hypothetical protein